MISLNGKELQVDDVVAIANGSAAGLDPAVIPTIQRSRAAVEQLVADGRIAYGITTGFGRFKDKLISPDQVKELQTTKQQKVVIHALSINGYSLYQFLGELFDKEKDIGK